MFLQTHVQNLGEWVKEHEDYNGELQEVEKWLLQMSSRLVTSDSMQTSSMEMATQQLARHKVINSLVFHQNSVCIVTIIMLQVTLSHLIIFETCGEQCTVLILLLFLGYNGGNSKF